MVSVAPISPTQPTNTGMTPEEREHQQEKVAAGAGGAASLTAKAANAASKKNVASVKLGTMMNSTQQAMMSANKSSKAAKSLWASFKNNIKFYTNDILRRLEGLKDAKFIGPIIKSPIMKKMAGFAGGALAFFVFITGINKAVKDGEIAVVDIKNKYNEFRAAA